MVTPVTTAVPSIITLLGQISTISDICECIFLPAVSNFFSAVLKFTNGENGVYGNWSD